MGKKYTAQQFLAAIPGTGGIINTIARRVGCDWHTAESYIRDMPSVRQAYLDEKSAVDDAAESVVIEDIVKKKDIGTAKWWLERKRRDQFSTRQELTGADGEAVQVITRIVERRNDSDADD